MIERPQPDEYPPFAAKYVNLVGHDPILEILEHLMDHTYNTFTGLEEGKGEYAYAEGKWTVKQMLGHMSDTERIFAYRALCFSREAIELPGFDQDIYMEKATFNSRSLKSIAGEFKMVRECSLYLLKATTDEQYLQKGIASGSAVSVRGLAYMMAGHEMHHLKIFEERYF